VSGAPDIRPLYGLPNISRASDVVLVEGEGCADALVALGIIATSAMQGANAPVDKTDWSPLSGKTVKIWPDADDPGRKYAHAVAAKLAQIGCRVLIVTIPADKSEGWDVVDCIDEGGDPRAILTAL
jgi:DNA primase